MADTICAIATAPVTGAVGIIRISGPESLRALEGLFFPDSGAGVAALPARRASLGGIYDCDGLLLDKCLLLPFPAPGSYTGEDCAELHCHGGMALLDRVIALLHGRGVRAALPGEFTKRAFLNGKLDLSGAEAVSDLIFAETAEAVKNAAGQLSGRLFSELAGLSGALTDINAHFTAYIDYTDEGVEPPDMGRAAGDLREISEKLNALGGSFSTGRLFSEGVACAVIGRANTGKSSILNALAGFERSIVTEIPGTTRDTVDVRLRLGGLILNLTDTAGLNAPSDEAEALGIERTERAALASGLILAVFDGSAPAGPEDEKTLALAEKSGAQVICIMNKSDLPERFGGLPGLERGGLLRLSAKTGAGMGALKDEMLRRFSAGSLRPDGSIITNRRQAEAILRSARHAAAAAEGLEAGLTPDVVWSESDAALRALGEVTGREAGEDVLSRVFERFCVGK